MFFHSIKMRNIFKKKPNIEYVNKRACIEATNMFKNGGKIFKSYCLQPPIPQHVMLAFFKCICKSIYNGWRRENFWLAHFFPRFLCKTLHEQRCVRVLLVEILLYSSIKMGKHFAELEKTLNVQCLFVAGLIPFILLAESIRICFS